MRTLVIAAALTLAAPAYAANFWVDSFAGNIPIIDINGPIVAGDQAKFNYYANALPFAVVRLESNGGDVSAALDMGTTISQKGYSTYVSQGKLCASACGMIWLAGSHRAKDASALVGLHAAYTTVDGRNEEYGVGNAVVGAYMTKLHYSIAAIIFATSAKPEAMNWITIDNGKKYDIAFDTLPDIENSMWRATTVVANFPVKPMPKRLEAKPVVASNEPLTLSSAPKPTRYEECRKSWSAQQCVQDIDPAITTPSALQSDE